MHDVEYFLNSDARVPEYQEYLKDHEAYRVFLENELAHLSKEDLERIIHNPIRGNLSQEGLPVLMYHVALMTAALQLHTKICARNTATIIAAAANIPKVATAAKAC